MLIIIMRKCEFVAVTLIMSPIIINCYVRSLTNNIIFVNRVKPNLQTHLFLYRLRSM